MTPRSDDSDEKRTMKTERPNLPRAIREFLADLLFPRFCIGCGTGGTYLCDDCLRSLPKKTEQTCPFCETVIVPDGRTCLSCAPRHALDGLFAAVGFHDAKTVAEAVHVLKYEYVRELAAPLGQLLSEAVGRTDLPLPDLVVPVPLHPWRLRYRGFNQSSLIAESFVSLFMPEFRLRVREDLLTRHRFTLPQAKSRTAKDRRSNLRDAFSVPPHNAADLRGSTIWIVDDVATTGATLEECAKALKRSGAKKVFGIVVAR